MTHAERIAAIRSMPDELEAALNELPAGGIDRSYREGGWTARQLVHHLADSHMNAFTRCKLILTEDNPTIKPYSQDEWAKGADYKGSVDTSLAILRGMHSRWADLFEAAKPEDWNRTLNHPENGPMTLERLLVIYSDHGPKHIGHIRSIR
jgi:hypothetical protein